MKIEDLTLKEIKEICDKYSLKGCCNEDCPILRECCNCLAGYPSCWTTEDMEREVTNER